jgi:hypothetical protein
VEWHFNPIKQRINMTNRTVTDFDLLNYLQENQAYLKTVLRATEVIQAELQKRSVDEIHLENQVKYKMFLDEVKSGYVLQSYSKAKNN